MTLTELIKQDLIVAMKAKDAATLSTLRLLSASLKNKAIELKRELEDVDVVAVVRSDTKKLVDALEEFVKAAREDLVEKSKIEIETLKKYLPPEMDAAELEKIIQAKLKDLGIESVSDMGKAMGAVMGELKGKVDGTKVKEMVAKVLKSE